MPINQHLANNQDPLIQAEPKKRRSSGFADFLTGLTFGLALVIVGITIYLVTTGQFGKFVEIITSYSFAI